MKGVEIKQIKLSPWKLNLYKDCPRCFWFQGVKGIKQPKGPMPTITGGLDRVIKNYFNEYRKKEQLPPIIGGKIKGKLIKEPLSYFIE